MQAIMTKSTKIVATLGPATETPEMIEALIRAGMNVARFNTKHADPEWHDERVQRVRKVADEMKAGVGILLDLQGPEVRIDLPDQKEFAVKKGEKVIFTTKDQKISGNHVYVPADVIASLHENDMILLEDGACEFQVLAKDNITITATATIDCVIKPRKTMNTPGVVLEMPSLTERDIAYLDKVSPKNVDFVGLSFVRNKVDIAILRSELEKRGFNAQIIAKIENQQAIDNLDEIIEAADGAMVARGDLGVEVPFRELTHWQRTIIEKCRRVGKPVITATEMLKSMIEKPRPTRAEVSDVAHAIYDGTDAVMLSEETTIGKYPVKAVETQATIAEYNEPFSQPTLQGFTNNTTDEAVTQAAIALINESKIKTTKIVCLTETGETARLIARFRPHLPIIALARTRESFHALSVVFGVQPILMTTHDDEITTDEQLLQVCRERNIVLEGETILLVRGNFTRKAGQTNTLSLLTV